MGRDFSARADLVDGRNTSGEERSGKRSSPAKEVFEEGF
jgi:hypothetical protein